MTKREICDRLMCINDYAKAASHCWGEDTSINDFQEGLRHIASEAKMLILDIVADEEKSK